MKRHKPIYVLLAAALLLLAACRPSVPETVVQPDDMEDLLYDYFVSQGMAVIPDPQAGSSEDYRRALYFEAVLSKHGVTREQFDSSLVYYYTRADKFVDIYRHVQQRLSDDALAYGASAGEVERYLTAQSLSGDTADVWEGDRHVLLMPYAPYNRMQFVQKADTSFHKGDNLMMTFKSDFLYQGGSKDGLAYLAVKFTNDSIASAVTHFSVTGNTNLRLYVTDDNLRIKEVMGYIYLGQGFVSTADLRMLFLSRIQLIRIHKPKSPDNKSADKPAKAPADSLRTAPDSVQPRRHRLGERPMPMNP